MAVMVLAETVLLRIAGYDFDFLNWRMVAQLRAISNQ